MADLVEYVKMLIMNTKGKEQEKCIKILEVLEEKENDGV